MKARRCTAVSCAVALLGPWPGAARADENAPPEPDSFSLSWVAPEGCPSAADLQAGVRRLLGDASHAPAQGPIDVRAVVTRRDETWRVSLESGAGAALRHRALEATSCEGIADATALIIALMIDPEAVAASSQKEPEKHPEIPTTQPLTPARSDSSRAPRKVRSGAPSPTRWFAGILFAADVGALPTPSGALVAGLGVKGDLKLWLAGSYSLNRPVADATAPAGGRFSLASGLLRACYASRGRLSFGPCAGFELGVMRGESFGVDRESSGHALWSAGSGGLLLAWNLTSRLTVPLSLEALLPLSRPRFVLDRVSGDLFRTSAVSGRATLGLEFNF